MFLFKKSSLAIALVMGMATAANAETLTMGINYLAAPYSYQDESGNLTGFEIELIQAIGKEAGFDVKIEPTMFSRALPGLEKGEFDFVGHVYGSEERSQLYNMIHIHDDGFKFIRLKKSDMEPISENTKVSVISLSPQDEQLQAVKKLKYPNLEIAALDTNFLALKNLFMDKSEVMLAPISEINYLVKSYKDHEFQILDVPKEYVQSISINYTTKKDNAALAKRITDGLEATKKNGTFDTLKTKYNL
ncbi:transporter substrate-binding domain-containing protein [Dichelobacter nodosus]|uniref:transporter substrate-binding domain-containing protein n=1 Tax=Dichelobacter nodosus TaxID=870 RepID=UPI00107E9793|nr:transporter substrate-binding domain-containing protein [Dichelobacter nodosus]TGA66873.1 transporter substrate-binding domain-containing protein [Dichelobacter nodosus]